MSIHDGHRQRFKEEFLARPDSFPDHKLLELLLFYAAPRRDTNPTAHILMERFGSLSGVLDARVEELRKVPGVGDHAITLLKAAKELSGRYLNSRTSVEEIVNGTKAARRILQPYFFGARVERVCLLCMDGKGKNLGIRLMGEGSVNAAEVTTRGVVEAALSLNAVQAVLAHNHVSGLALPSVEDKLTTQHLAKVLSNVGVTLVDHLIFSDDDAVSLRDSGLSF
ncbi:MAG: DNA repair protein RadC [Oscillospiraceae bacterium]|nr:DNA repair protein RadC [Oscillospiraceae bacterium]